MRWDKEKFPEPNLHVYGKNCTKVMVYNVEKWPKKGIEKPKKGIEKPRAKKIKKYITKIRTLNS